MRRESKSSKTYAKAAIIMAMSAAAIVVVVIMFKSVNAHNGDSKASIYEDISSKQTLSEDGGNRILVEVTEKADSADAIADYIDGLVNEMLEGKYDRFISELALDEIEKFGYVPMDDDYGLYTSYLEDMRVRMLGCDIVYVYQVNKRNSHYTAVVYGLKQKEGITEPVYNYEDAVKLGFTVFKEGDGSLTMTPFHIGLLDECYALVGFRMSDEYRELQFRQDENEECQDNTGNILPDEYGNNQEDNFKDNPNIKSYERILKGTSGD